MKDKHYGRQMSREAIMWKVYVAYEEDTNSYRRLRNTGRMNLREAYDLVLNARVQKSQLEVN